MWVAALLATGRYAAKFSDTYLAAASTPRARSDCPSRLQEWGPAGPGAPLVPGDLSFAAPQPPAGGLLAKPIRKPAPCGQGLRHPLSRQVALHAWLGSCPLEDGIH